MIKRFGIETPEQLRMLKALVRQDSMKDRLGNCATVWSVERRKRGRTPWDGQMAVQFESVRFGARNAYVMNGEAVIAEVRYNPTLAFCRENLKMME